MKIYLNDTFDRGFGYPYHQLWTLTDLECRLESIRELFLPNNLKLERAELIFQELASISDVTPSTVSQPIRKAHYAAWDKAAQAFHEAKQALNNDGQHRYSWSDGYCHWVENSYSTIQECRNDDILTYQYHRGRNIISYAVIITCLAKLSDEGLLMTLSINSSINGKLIRIPLGQYSTNQDYNQTLGESFKIELKNLLLAIYKERKSI